MTHLFPVRVYHEDTDHTGVVYHAGYLRFIERARTEWARARGLDQGRLQAAEGTVFAVRRVEAEFLRPARFGDLLEVGTAIEGATGARLLLRQEVRREGALLFEALVTLVAMGPDGRPRRLPRALAGPPTP